MLTAVRCMCSSIELGIFIAYKLTTSAHVLKYWNAITQIYILERGLDAGYAINLYVLIICINGMHYNSIIKLYITDCRNEHTDDAYLINRATIMEPQ